MHSAAVTNVRALYDMRADCACGVARPTQPCRGFSSPFGQKTPWMKKNWTTQKHIVMVTKAAEHDESSWDEEEWDAVEAEINVEDFEDVQVHVEEEDGCDTMHVEYEMMLLVLLVECVGLNLRGKRVFGCRMMVWANYMQSDVQRGPTGTGDAEESMPTQSGDQRRRQQEEEEDIYSDKMTSRNSHPALAESAAARFFDGKTLPLQPNPGTQNEWDLRASMEKRKWFEEDYMNWQKLREETLGRYPSVSADWRTDVRIQDSQDPGATEYREWSMREIWELITQNGEAADPRDVPFKVRKPGSRTDFVAEGFVQHPDIPQWLAAQGKLMSEDDQNQVVDEEAEGALLTSEFSDFDTDFDFGES